MPTSSPRRVRTGVVLLVLVLVQLLGPASIAAEPAGAAEQQAAAAAAGTVDGRTRLTVTLPGDGRTPQAPGSVSVTADGKQLPAQVVPLISDHTATVVVVDTSEAGRPVLQPGLSGAASFVLTAPPTARAALVADADPPAVVAPLTTGPTAALNGLATVRSGGDRRTADALELALRQLPPEADSPHLVLLYTAAPDAAGPSAPDLAGRLTAAGAVLGVVVPGPDGPAAGSVPPYWRDVAAATGGVAVAAGPSGVITAFDELASALRTRYLVTVPAPEQLPATAVVRADTPQGPVTAQAVIPAAPPVQATGRAGGSGSGRVVGVVVGVVIGLALLAGLVLLTAGVIQAGRRRPAPDDAAEPVDDPESAGIPSTATAWNLPGREEHLAAREPLAAAMRAALRQGRPVVLQPAGGATGLGATSAMAEFAHRQRRDYDIVWRISAADPPLVADRMAELAETLGLADPTDTAEEATDHLLGALRHRSRWLLVLDDAVSPRQLARFLPGGPGHVLIASNDPEWAQHATPVPVPPFRRGESVAALRARRSGLTAAEADRLAGALDDVPLAVDLAGATLADCGMSVSSYLRQLAEHRPAAGGPAGAALAVALDRLAADQPSASGLLTTLAWWGTEPVPLSVLRAQPALLPPPLVAEAEGPGASQRATASEERTGPGSRPVDAEAEGPGASPRSASEERTGPGSRPFDAEAKAPAGLADLVAVLRRRGLVQADAETVRLHPVAARMLVTRASDEGCGAVWAANAVRLLRAVVPADPADPAVRATWRRLLPHVLAATDPARPLDDVLVDVGWLLQHAAGYLRGRGETRAARALSEDAYDLYRHRLGPDHPDTLASARTLADGLEADGEHDQARRLLHDAEVGGSGSPDGR